MDNTTRARKIRAMSGLTQAAFSEKYNIPKRTIENWESLSDNKRNAPDYVLDLLERVVKEDFNIE
jgi:putative transcriptional regulator